MEQVVRSVAELSHTDDFHAKTFMGLGYQLAYLPIVRQLKTLNVARSADAQP